MRLIGIDCERNGASEAPLQSYGTWNEPPTRFWRSLTACISESVEDRHVKFWHNIDSNFKLKSISFIEWKLFAYKSFRNFGNFQQFSFIITVDWMGNSNSYWFHRKDLDKMQIYQCQSYLIWKNIFSYIKIHLKVKKWVFLGFVCSFFFRITYKAQRFRKFWWSHRIDLLEICQKQS